MTTNAMTHSKVTSTLATGLPGVIARLFIITRTPWKRAAKADLYLALGIVAKCSGKIKPHPAIDVVFPITQETPPPAPAIEIAAKGLRPPSPSSGTPHLRSAAL